LGLFFGALFTVSVYAGGAVLLVIGEVIPVLTNGLDVGSNEVRVEFFQEKRFLRS